MSIFNIKLKTKNGNNVKDKVVFNIYFQLKYSKGLTTRTAYTYRIYYGNKDNSKIKDTRGVFEIKDSNNVISGEDLTIKVMLNLIHIIVGISKKENLNPDAICFISTDFNTSNLVWRALLPMFRRNDIPMDVEFSRMTVEPVEMLKSFVNINPNVSFSYIDPKKDTTRYAKSIIICSQLKGRIEELQVTKET
jgi:hypothetical protein